MRVLSRYECPANSTKSYSEAVTGSIAEMAPRGLLSARDWEADRRTPDTNFTPKVLMLPVPRRLGGSYLGQTPAEIPKSHHLF